MPRRAKQTETRPFWIRARVRAEELAIIESRAARADRTVSEFVRDTLLAPVNEVQSLNAIERHDLARIALAIKQGDRSHPLLDDLQNLIKRIDSSLP